MGTPASNGYDGCRRLLMLELNFGGQFLSYFAEHVVPMAWAGLQSVSRVYSSVKALGLLSLAWLLWALEGASGLVFAGDCDVDLGVGGGNGWPGGKAFLSIVFLTLWLY